MLTLEILFVLGLVLLNGGLAMSERAIVSSRPGRLRAMRDRGGPGATTALQLAENPGRFLSTVQVGITLVGILAGAVSGAALGDRLSAWFEGLGMDPDSLEAVLQQHASGAARRPRPRVLYTIPTGHNPTGATLPNPRRRRVGRPATR